MKVNYTMKSSISTSIIVVLLASCTYFNNKKAEKKMQEYTEYKDLHKHLGTDNYEVVNLLEKDFQSYEVFIDKKQKLLSLKGKNEELKKAYRKKVDFFGNILGEGLLYNTLKDGTMWSSKTYNNWFINGDQTKHKYLDPFTNKEIADVYDFKNSETDFKKWFEKFKEYYEKASYVYENYGSYYFKIDNKWYLINDKLEDSPDNFRDQYPAKINPEEIRMVAFTESMEDLMKQGVIKVVDYIEQDSEKGIGLNPINFSSGYYMLALHLPQGDTLKFRRYGARGFNADMRIYQIPKELGGSDQVFFIEQLPRQTYPEKSFAGFYAIRPRNYKQLPEYKPYLEKEKQSALKTRRKIMFDR